MSIINPRDFSLYDDVHLEAYPRERDDNRDQRAAREDELKLSPREFIIYKLAWSLTEEERSKLSRYFLLKATYSSFLESHIFDSGGFERLILEDATEEHKQRTVRINYHDTNYQAIEELVYNGSETKQNKLLLVSVRINIPHRFWECLVRKVTSDPHTQELKEKAIWLEDYSSDKIARG